MAKPHHILIVEARFYDEIADLLVRGAVEELERAGATYEKISVPGALEIPAAIKTASRKPKAPQFDGYIALGCVIRGKTSHYDIVCHESARGLGDLSLHLDLSIGNGILTCDNREQAIVRADPEQKNKGKDAASAVLSLLEIKNYFGVKE